MRADPMFEKWCRWLKTVSDDLHHTYFYRDIFLGTIRLVEQNPRIDRRSFFFGFFQGIYVDSVVMAIRRQVKSQKDSVSLAGLLTELAANPEPVTRAGFLELYRPSNSQSNGERDFATYAPVGASHIDAVRVIADLKALQMLAASAEEYADKRVAHWDKREPSSDLTTEVIFATLEELGRLVRKYYLLFFAADLVMSPVPQGPVFHVFEEPWLPRSPAGADESNHS
jgi:hypothetical protein